MSIAENLSAAAVAFLVSVIVVAYGGARVGWPIEAFVVLPVALAAAGATVWWLRTHQPPSLPATGDGGPRHGWRLIAWLGVVGAALGGLLWLSRPEFLPIGSGPDLTHHLMLIDYIERSAQLPDAWAGPSLGEMAHYTPGVHLLATLAGAWLRSDGFHTVFGIVALTVALKAGFVFLIAHRSLPPGATRLPMALAAVLMACWARAYALGSFAVESFFAQVASELFAVAAWWATVVWNERPSPTMMALVAMAGVGVFLTWPIWIGPVLLVLGIVVLTREGLALKDKVAALALATVPIMLVAIVHAAGRVEWVGIAATSGAVVRPSLNQFGTLFLTLCSAGVVVSITDHRRITVYFLAALALQGGVLYLLANRQGAAAPYMALKMVYLAIYPMAICAAIALAALFRVGAHPFVAWGLVLLIAIATLRPIVNAPAPTPVVSRDLYEAGRWAREHLPADCVEYLVGSEYTSYWLHLAVLGNQRASDRTRDDNTFDPSHAVGRWLVPDGLRYAIADLKWLASDARSNVNTIAQFGDAAVVTRASAGRCP